MENQKKRVLEALECRVAVAKAEAQHLNISGKKICGGLGQGSKASTGPSSEASPTHTKDKLLKKDLNAGDLTYSQLSQPIHENLLTVGEISNKEKNTVDKILHDFLQKGDSAQKYMQGSRSVKLDNWILLDNFVKGNSTSASRLEAFKRNSKRFKRHMSVKQLKMCGSMNLPKEFHKFEIFMPMHTMWKDYVTQLLKHVGKDQVGPCLLGADLHGAILRVIECKSYTFVGLVGIMIRETAETFGIITQDNKFRVVPKRNSVFVLQADCWRITLHGDKYCSRI